MLLLLLLGASVTEVNTENAAAVYDGSLNVTVTVADLLVPTEKSGNIAVTPVILKRDDGGGNGGTNDNVPGFIVVGLIVDVPLYCLGEIVTVFVLFSVSTGISSTENIQKVKGTNQLHLVRYDGVSNRN